MSSNVVLFLREQKLLAVLLELVPALVPFFCIWRDATHKMIPSPCGESIILRLCKRRREKTGLTLTVRVWEPDRKREGYFIFPNSTTEDETVDWLWLFGELPSGEYKFQRSIFFIRQPGDFDKYILEQTFSIGSSSDESISIDFNYQILRTHQHENLNHVTTVISSRAELEQYYKFACPL